MSSLRTGDEECRRRRHTRERRQGDGCLPMEDARLYLGFTGGGSMGTDVPRSRCGRALGEGGIEPVWGRNGKARTTSRENMMSLSGSGAALNFKRPRLFERRHARAQPPFVRRGSEAAS